MLSVWLPCLIGAVFLYLLYEKVNSHQIRLDIIFYLYLWVYIPVNSYVMNLQIKPTYIIIAALVGVVVFLLMLKD